MPFQTALDTQEPQSFELHYDPLEFQSIGEFTASVDECRHKSDPCRQDFEYHRSRKRAANREPEESERRYRTLVEN